MSEHSAILAPELPLPVPDRTLLRKGDIGVVSRPIVNCRGWMSAHAIEVGKLRKNNKVELLSDPTVSGRELWVKVRSVMAGIEGFLPLRFLEVHEIRTRQPEGATPLLATVVEVDTPLQRGDLFVTTLQLNLRQEPGKDGEILAILPPGSKGRMLDGVQRVDEIDWIEAQMPEGTGWLAAGYTRSVARGGRWIEADLSSQTLTAWNDDEVVAVSPISSGKPGFQTPRGVFTISTKWPARRAIGSKHDEAWNIPAVPWVMVFRSGGFYVHGVYWRDDFGEPVSHGCVTLPVAFAEWLYDWTPPGTRIWIHG